MLRLSKTLYITDSTALKIVRCNDDAKPPSRGFDKAAGYDLYSVQSYEIPSKHVEKIDTGIAVGFPPVTYGRKASRSGLALHHHITVLGGVIDPDYTGTIKI